MSLGIKVTKAAFSLKAVAPVNGGRYFTLHQHARQRRAHTTYSDLGDFGAVRERSREAAKHGRSIAAQVRADIEAGDETYVFRCGLC